MTEVQERMASLWASHHRLDAATRSLTAEEVTGPSYCTQWTIAQLLSPRPKPQIIASSLQTLLSILEKAGPEVLTKDVEASLARLRDFLLQWNA